MMREKKDCGNCKYQMTGFDGGFCGLPMTCECKIYGETENRKNCSEYEKKLTKYDLLMRIHELEEENEQLKERNEKLIKKLDRLEQYIETIFNNESFVCKHLDIEEVQFYCERNQDYCSPTCAYRKCYDENVMFRLVDKIREVTE